MNDRLPTFAPSCLRHWLAGWAFLLCSLPAAVAGAETAPRIAVVQCMESYDEDWYQSQMSSQALVGMAVLLGVKYETVVLEELLDEPPDSYSGLWFSSCLWIGQSNYDQLVQYLADHLSLGGAVFIDGPLGPFFRDSSGNSYSRGMDELAPILGVDWGGWRNTSGYDIVTTSSQHPVSDRAGYSAGTALTVGIKDGTDTLLAADVSAHVLVDVLSPFDGISYPFVVVAEPLSGARVAAVGGYGNFGGVASPFRNSPSTQFVDNHVLPYLLETLIWTTAADSSPYAGLQVSHAPITMLGRLDGDWSDVGDATADTLDYLLALSEETGITTIYGIVSEFAEEDGTWPVFAEFGGAFEAVGSSIGSHSATHITYMSDELDSAGWDVEVDGSLDQIYQNLTAEGFEPDAYAFINPGNTIRAEDYGEFFADIEVYLSHGFEMYTPYSTGVQGFGLPSGVPDRAVINDVPAPDYQWLYSSSWDYTVEEAAAYQASILDYYQDTLGRGAIYNMMWHDYALGGNASPEHYPDTPSTLPLFETSREHFWQNQVYAPTVEEAVAKLYVSQGTVITSSYAGNLQVDLDYAGVPSSYRDHIAGMGMRIHQQDQPIARVWVDGAEHYGFTDDTVMVPAPSSSSQQIEVQFGQVPDPGYRLIYASKPAASVTASGGGVVASLAQPGLPMKYCFAGPATSVVLGANRFERTSDGDACGYLELDNPLAELEIQPFDTGDLGLLVVRATRPLTAATVIEGGIRIQYLAGDEAIIEFESPEQPTEVIVDGVSVIPASTAQGFQVTIPANASAGVMEVLFDEQTCEPTQTSEVSCSDGIDNDCDGAPDCADSDCDGVGACGAEPRVVILTQVSDATVRDSSPGQNFGSDDTLEVDSSEFKYALVKPDNLADIAPGSEVVSAELVVEVFNPGDFIEVRQVLGSWAENQVTYSSAPLVTQSPSTTVSGAVVGQVSIDITAIAQAWVNGDSVQGVELYPTGSDGVDMYSSEWSSSSLRPYFVIEVIDGGGQCSSTEICDDGIDNDCDGQTDCADSGCTGAGVCTSGRTVMVTALSDTMVRQTEPDRNFGSRDSLEVDTASVFQYALIKPDNLADIAPGAQVVKAELVIDIFNPGDAMEVRQVLGNWSESQVTWNSAPQVTDSAYATVAGNQTGQLSIDITAIAQTWVDGGGVHGIELYPTGSDGVDIYSSESGSSSVRPYFLFEIVDDGGQCTDGDGDGYMAGFCGGDDCDDAHAATHPGAAELCDDGLDNDCDSQIDCADGDCSAASVCQGGDTVVTVVVDDLLDAYVTDASPSSNFGGADFLTIDTWSARERAFIAPSDLGGIEPGAEVISAQLLVHIHDAGSQVNLAPISSGWSEGSITWNNAPSSGTAVTAIPSGTSGDIAIDVTGLVQSWVDGAPLYGIALEPTSSNGVELRSSEYADTAARPTLVIEARQ